MSTDSTLSRRGFLGATGALGVAWLELATIDGARDLGLDDRSGSLTPGKRADLILVRAA